MKAYFTGNSYLSNANRFFHVFKMPRSLDKKIKQFKKKKEETFIDKINSFTEKYVNPEGRKWASLSG